MKMILMNRTLLVLSLLISLVIGGNVMAEESQPVLVFDSFETDSKTAKKLRIIEKMSSSASGQFTAKELQNLLARLPAAKEDVWIIDLRQESHAFINGIPVSWYKRQNTGNINKTAEQISIEEQKLVQDLSSQTSIQVYTIKKLPAGEFVGDKPETIIPHNVQTENQLVTDLGANYQRFYVLDHNRPDDQEVDTYVEFIKSKVNNIAWLHFHCRGGKGRSSTFMAMYDMIRHAQHTSFDDIIKRQADMGNIKLDAMPTKAEKLWKTDTLKERYDFLKTFYSYVTDPNGYAVRDWSSWLKLSAMQHKK